MTDSLESFKARVPIAEVIGRSVKLRPAGRGEFTGLCPFHQERTPSFTVSSTKGFGHCFGCGWNGDVIDFVAAMEGFDLRTQFRETVERVAEIVGIDPPERLAGKRDPREARLHAACENAAKWFHHLLLNTSHGAQALTYLEGRGIGRDMIERFQIGFAPEQRFVIVDVLGKHGQTLSDLIGAGLLVVPEDGGRPFAKFRNRVMFPIWDARGRVVGFSGRALSPKVRAKYMNSPETPIFHKGSLLYGHHLAADPAKIAKTVVVVEGCMDTVACARAGIGHAVAQLGTAVTEEQIKAIWRLSDQPIVALDGDRAGRAAGRRLIETSLPAMEPGKSLRFSIFPDGADPDDMVTRRGPGALAAQLGRAVSLMDFLWNFEVAAAGGTTALESPESRAALRSRINDLINTVPNYDLKKALRDDLAERWQRAFYPASGKAPVIGGDPLSAIKPRVEADLLAAVVARPGILDVIEDEFEALAFTDKGYEHCRREIIAWRNESAERGGAWLDLPSHLSMATSADMLDEIRRSPVYAEAASSDTADGQVIDAWRARVLRIADVRERHQVNADVREAYGRGDHALGDQLFESLQKRLLSIDPREECHERPG